MTAPLKVNVGSRSSPLSLAQTGEVLSRLQAQYPDTEFIVVPIATSGDRDKEAPLLSLGRGTFVKEIELALVNGEIDLAVHSAKDVPSELPQGLTLTGAGIRQDPRDVLVNRWRLSLMELPAHTRLGTSSPRRIAQLKALRSDLKLLPIRGNVGTRLDKARGKDYDGVVLAAAGLIRLGRQEDVSEYLSPEICTPDVGQGMLAAEVRSDDTRIIQMLAGIEDGPSSAALQAERAFLAELGGGCEVPIAAYARVEGSELNISAMAADTDGSRVFRTRVTHLAGDPRTAGKRTAEALLETGAREIIELGP